jgi:hypothetical protein
MIWDSLDWKRDLLKLAKRMEARRTQSRWPPKSLYGVERDFFTGFYIVRRLREAGKLSDEVSYCRLQLHRYPSTDERATFMNWHNLDALYDFARQAHQHAELAFVCNQFIHSYVFMPVISPETRGLEGALFNSDRHRDTLFEIPVVEVISTWMRVATDNPSRLDGHFKPTKGDWALHLSSRSPGAPHAGPPRAGMPLSSAGTPRAPALPLGLSAASDIVSDSGDSHIADRSESDGK